MAQSTLQKEGFIWLTVPVGFEPIMVGGMAAKDKHGGRSRKLGAHVSRCRHEGERELGAGQGLPQCCASSSKAGPLTSPQTAPSTRNQAFKCPIPGGHFSSKHHRCSSHLHKMTSHLNVTYADSRAHLKSSEYNHNYNVMWYRYHANSCTLGDTGREGGLGMLRTYMVLHKYF